MPGYKLTIPRDVHAAAPGQGNAVGHFWQTGDATTHQYYVGRHIPASDYASLTRSCTPTGAR